MRKNPGTSLVVQWLRLCASTAGGTGSIPGQGTKNPECHLAASQKKILFFPKMKKRERTQFKFWSKTKQTIKPNKLHVHQKGDHFYQLALLALTSL